GCGENIKKLVEKHGRVWGEPSRVRRKFTEREHHGNIDAALLPGRRGKIAVPSARAFHLETDFVAHRSRLVLRLRTKSHAESIEAESMQPQVRPLLQVTNRRAEKACSEPTIRQRLRSCLEFVVSALEVYKRLSSTITEGLRLRKAGFDFA